MSPTELVFKDIENFIKCASPSNETSCQLAIHSYAVSLNMKKGVYNGAEEYYTGQFVRLINMLGKVSYKFELGKIYWHYQRFDEAKAAFDFVGKHGNKLYKVQEAKGYLNQLG